MNRGVFVQHLIDQECYPDDECDSDVSQLWHNGINGHSCYVPYVDELTITTWAHIVYELRIDPPLEFNSDYYVYRGWRDRGYFEVIKTNSNNN